MTCIMKMEPVRHVVHKMSRPKLPAPADPRKVLAKMITRRKFDHWEKPLEKVRQTGENRPRTCSPRSRPITPAINPMLK